MWNLHLYTKIVEKYRNVPKNKQINSIESSEIFHTTHLYNKAREKAYQISSTWLDKIQRLMRWNELRRQTRYGDIIMSKIHTCNATTTTDRTRNVPPFRQRGKKRENKGAINWSVMRTHKTFQTKHFSSS